MNRAERIAYRNQDPKLLLEAGNFSSDDKLVNLILKLWVAFVDEAICMDELIFRVLRVVNDERFSDKRWDCQPIIDYGLAVHEMIDLSNNTMEKEVHDAVDFLLSHPSLKKHFDFALHTCDKPSCESKCIFKGYFEGICKECMLREEQEGADDLARSQIEAEQQAEVYYRTGGHGEY